MTLHNPPAPLIHDLKMGEDLHGMIMLVASVPVPRQFRNCGSEVCGPRVGDGSGEPEEKKPIGQNSPQTRDRFPASVEIKWVVGETGNPRT